MSEYQHREDLRETVDDLLAIRDDLYLAGYDVPMPARPGQEAHIQRVLTEHRTALAATRTEAGPAKTATITPALQRPVPHSQAGRANSPAEQATTQATDAIAQAEAAHPQPGNTAAQATDAIAQTDAAHAKPGNTAAQAASAGTQARTAHPQPGNTAVQAADARVQAAEANTRATYAVGRATDAGAGKAPAGIRRRRLFALAGGVVAAAGAGTAGVIALDQARPRQAFAATPAALTIRPIPGDPGGNATARTKLEEIAARILATAAAAAGPVDHLVTDSWSLNSEIDGKTVTSAVVTTRRQLWRAADGSALTIDEYLPPQFPTAEDRAAWRDDGSPGQDRSPRRTRYPAGTFVAAWAARPPVRPELLGPWLRRQDTSGTAIPSAIGDLLGERALTGPERGALLGVLAGEPSLTLLGTATDRAGRDGLVFALRSAASGADVSYRYVVDPGTGTVSAREELLISGAKALRVRRPAVIASSTYVTADFAGAVP